MIAEVCTMVGDTGDDRILQFPHILKRVKQPAKDVIQTGNVSVIALPRAPDLRLRQALRSRIGTQEITLRDRGRLHQTRHVDR